MKKVLITGKDSYIGTSFENWLKREPGRYAVDTADLRDPGWRERDFSVYDVVFHVAGIAHVSAKRNMEDLYYKINRDLAVETAEKSKMEGVKQFIFLSSIIVYGRIPEANDGVIKNDTIPHPTGAYGKSKLQAEERLQELGSDDFKMVILRPPMIYGNGSKGNYPKLSKLARSVPVFPDVDNMRSMLHIDNLCEFVKGMIEKEERGVFFPQNLEYVKTSEMVRLIAELHGRRIHMTHAFNFLIIPMAKKSRLISKMFGNLAYHMSMSHYEGYEYRIRGLRESLEVTEQKAGMKVGKHKTLEEGMQAADQTLEGGLVSIIMPAYNCENYIGDAIDSVIRQSYDQWELIVVDDCSKDHTPDIVKRYMKEDSRIRYYKLERNSGAAIARNRAVDEAAGKYIAFLDSDDLWFPDKLRKQIQFMEDNRFGFTCTSYTKIDEQGNDLGRSIVSALKRDYNGVLKTCPGNSTVIYNAEKLGKFKIPDIRKRNDYVMWLQVIKKEKYLYGIEEPLGSHRIRTEAISSNKASLVGYHWKVYREIERLPLIKSAYLIVYWIAATVFKLR